MHSKENLRNTIGPRWTRFISITYYPVSRVKVWIHQTNEQKRIHIHPSTANDKHNLKWDPCVSFIPPVSIIMWDKSSNRKKINTIYWESDLFVAHSPLVWCVSCFCSGNQQNFLYAIYDAIQSKPIINSSVQYNPNKSFSTFCFHFIQLDSHTFIHSFIRFPS